MKTIQHDQLTFVAANFMRLAVISLACCAPAAIPAYAQVIIVLDSGHSGKDVRVIDQKTGLIDHDYPNHPEMEECFRIAKIVETQLVRKGYEVVLTKSSASDTVSLRARAAIAQRKHAVLGVSIHDDHSMHYSSFAQVYSQAVGLWRGRSAKHPKAVFENAEIAKQSQSYAAIFARERSRCEQHQVRVAGVNFSGRPGLEPGNIPQVSLFAGSGPSAVPWVYNEVGGIGLGTKQEARYAQGLIDAIEVCVPVKSKNQ